MYRVKKKIPTNNINEILMGCYQLLYEQFPTLILDNRPNLEGPNNSDKMPVYYTAILRDGFKKEIGDHSIEPKKMSIEQFLRFVKENNPERIWKTVTTDEYMCNPDDYEQVDFYNGGIRVTVKPHIDFLGGYSVKLEIEAQEQHKAKVQSIIDKLQNSN